MKNLGVNEIRELFLQFFESKDHLRLNSFSVVPREGILHRAGNTPQQACYNLSEMYPYRGY